MSNALGKKELRALLEENNVEGWNKRTSLEELVSLAVDNELVDVDAGSDKDGDEDAAPVSSGPPYLWIKKKAYFDDKLRVGQGFYSVDEVPERLANNPAVVVFEDDVPVGTLPSIARWCGINPDGLDEDEILALVVNKNGLQPY